VRHAAGASWKRAIRDLVLLGMRYAAPPTVIGSLFWQYRTGLRYLSAQSDIDVLWQAPPGYCIRSLLAGVETIEQAEGIRIDGEVIFRDGSAVNWRELHLALGQGCTAEVLVKSMHSARLTKLSDLAAAWKAT
jgi:phosphoribosyl-dephospho-CoA transferase